MLVSKYTPHTSSSLLKLKSKFHNRKLELIKKDPNEWISNLEGVRVYMSKFGLKGCITVEDFMIHVLNNLPKEYDVVLDGLENHCMVIGNDALTIAVICKNFNHQHEKIKNKNEETREKEKTLGTNDKQY